MVYLAKPGQAGGYELEMVGADEEIDEAVRTSVSALVKDEELARSLAQFLISARTALPSQDKTTWMIDELLEHQKVERP